MHFVTSFFLPNFSKLHPLTTTGIAPVAILTILNVRICKGIVLLHQRRTNRNAKEINMTYIAIAIVGLFVVTNLPRILLGFHEVSREDLSAGPLAKWEDP